MRAGVVAGDAGEGSGRVRQARTQPELPELRAGRTHAAFRLSAFGSTAGWRCSGLSIHFKIASQSVRMYAVRTRVECWVLNSTSAT